MNDVTDFGAIGDGNVANADINTAAFLKAMAGGPTGPKGIFVPASPGGFVVNNGQIVLIADHSMISGMASQGASFNGPTSLLIGHGPGHTLTVNGAGCVVEGLAFKPNVKGEQKGTDSYILATNTQPTLRDLYMYSPNIGITLQLPTLAEGEFWLENILIGGNIGYAGIVANAGDAAIYMRHIIMYGDGTQPQYGILVTSCGELDITGGTDIINMGNCLALRPGMNGVKSQHIIAVLVSESLFDSGNGQGCVYICPETDAFVNVVKFTNVWTSTSGNNNGNNPTNGFTFDGTRAKPALPVPAIQDVTLVNCVGKSFKGHCGVYANNVQGLSIQASTFGDNNVGIWLKNCSEAQIIGNKCGAYSGGFFPGTNGGNTVFGIFIEATLSPFMVMMNMCYGNPQGGVHNANSPLPYQMVQFNQG